MTLYLLTQTVWNEGASVSNAGAGSTAPGYSMLDLVSGPRSTRWRSAASASAIRAAYISPGFPHVTHIVLARADWLLTLETTRIRGIQRDSGGSWSYMWGYDFNPLTEADLLGPRAQDLVVAVFPTWSYGAGVEILPLGASATAAQLSKLYVCQGFAFGVPPSVQRPPRRSGLQSSPTPEKAFPFRGYQPFAVEREIVITWEGVSRYLFDYFISTPKMFEWPLFLYDDSADIWDWQLEHVIITDYDAQLVGEDTLDLTVTFHRLKHYE